MVVKDLGQVDYQKAWDLQKSRLTQMISDDAEDALFLCEHNHVYTFGKSADRSNLLISEAFLNQIGAQKFEIERGGDITYHGPGQLVGYPILNLPRRNLGIRNYVHLLEESIICTLKTYGIETERTDGLTGIWLKSGPARKIGAIGIKVSRGVTMHGFALNVNTDLSYFSHIVPCGIQDKGVTSMANELGYELAMFEVKEHYVKQFLTLLNGENVG